MNPQPKNCINSYWMPTVVFGELLNVDRNAVLQLFSEREIDARPFFWPLSSLPMFEPVKENEISYSISSRGINLPSYFDMTYEDQTRVAETVKEYIKRIP